jgi:Zn-dependent protease
VLENLDVANLAIWLVAFLLSTTCHEAAHALAGRLGGDDTAREQVTLNPLPHMKREPFGMVIMPLLSYVAAGWMMGWASAPYDPYWAQRHPRKAALMAAAGPAANFLLAGIAIVVLRLAYGGAFGFGPTVAAVASFLGILALLNAILGVFNLLPVPPLDGASILVGLGGPVGRAMERFRAAPMAGIIGLLAAWQLFRLIAPAVAGAVRALAVPGV